MHDESALVRSRSYRKDRWYGRRRRGRCSRLLAVPVEFDRWNSAAPCSGAWCGSAGGSARGTKGIATGRVIICGFNSLSLWGFLRWCNTFRGLMPLSSIRIQDWISVLGIHRDQPVRYLNCYGRMVHRTNSRSFGRVAEKLPRIPFPFGDVYVICGVKQRGAFIPPRMAGFSRLPKVGSIGLPRPIARR